jgi:hypothetical protein
MLFTSGFSRIDILSRRSCAMLQQASVVHVRGFLGGCWFHWQAQAHGFCDEYSRISWMDAGFKSSDQ